MNYDIKTIQTILRATILKPLVKETEVLRYLIFDSRRVLQPVESLFFALKSGRNDGHRFLEELYERGVRNFVVSQAIAVANFPEANFLKVSDSLAALQRLATFHRQQFHLPTIGITGSNGKTIAKEWLFYLFSKMTNLNVVRSPKSYNSQIGVPLSVWHLQPHHDLAIFEAGVSTTGEMERLAPMIACDFGIFTNIGTAHQEGFSSLKEKVKEKLKLFKFAKKILYCADYDILNEEIQQLQIPFFVWSKKKKEVDFFISEIKKEEKTTITGIFQNQPQTIAILYHDEASIENAINVWATLLALGYRTEDFRPLFEQLPPVALRLELKQANNDCTLINDSYNLDLNSLQIALDFLEQQTTHDRRTLILSDILQSGLPETELYQLVASWVIQKNIQKFIGIGQAIGAMEAWLSPRCEVYFFKNTADFLKNYPLSNFYQETILLKGARAFTFEQIANRLESQAHSTVLEINLNALAHNLKVYRSFLKPTTKLMAMVKASAYGSGSGEVAKLLQFENVDYLAVAYSDEGVALRRAGVRLPIVVLNPDEASLDSVFRHHLEPEIYNFRLLEKFLQRLRQGGGAAPYPIHLKLDTGMKRLGFEEADMEKLVQKLNAEQLVRVETVFSHLVASDAAEHDAFTRQQIQRFEAMCGYLLEHLPNRPLRHLLNSGGISRFSDYQMDMVRLGIGLYGVDSDPEIQAKLLNISTLKATISQIKTVKKGETVGYNRVGKVERDSRIATISIGYADGFSRKLSNGRGSVRIRGQEAFVVGNVCMDMCMVDISHISDATEGDEVVIFGENHPIRLLASRLETIPYEVLTNISDRVKRVYFQD